MLSSFLLCSALLDYLFAETMKTHKSDQPYEDLISNLEPQLTTKGNCEINTQTVHIHYNSLVYTLSFLCFLDDNFTFNWSKSFVSPQHKTNYNITKHFLLRISLLLSYTPTKKQQTFEEDYGGYSHTDSS